MTDNWCKCCRTVFFSQNYIGCITAAMRLQVFNFSTSYKTPVLTVILAIEIQDLGCQQIKVS